MKSTRSPGIFHGWFLIATGSFVAMVAMGSNMAFGVFVIPMSDEFQWSRSTISIAIAMGSLIGGVSQPFMGRIFDKLGGRKLILTGIFVTGTATLLLTFTNHILFFVFLFGVVGALGRAAGGETGA